MTYSIYDYYFITFAFLDFINSFNTLPSTWHRMNEYLVNLFKLLESLGFHSIAWSKIYLQ